MTDVEALKRAIKSTNLDPMVAGWAKYFLAALPPGWRLIDIEALVERAAAVDASEHGWGPWLDLPVGFREPFIRSARRLLGLEP